MSGPQTRWKRGGGAFQHQAGHKSSIDEDAEDGAAAAAAQETVDEVQYDRDVYQRLIAESGLSICPA